MGFHRLLYFTADSSLSRPVYLRLTFAGASVRIQLPEQRLQYDSSCSRPPFCPSGTLTRGDSTSWISTRQTWSGWESGRLGKQRRKEGTPFCGQNRSSSSRQRRLDATFGANEIASVSVREKMHRKHIGVDSSGARRSSGIIISLLHFLHCNIAYPPVSFVPSHFTSHSTLERPDYFACYRQRLSS